MRERVRVRMLACVCMCVYVCVCVWVGVGVSEKTWMLLLERQLRIWLPPIQTCFTWSLFSTPFSYPDLFWSLFDGERLDKKWMAGKAWKILNDVISWHYKVPWNLSYFQQQQQQHIQLQQQRQHQQGQFNNQCQEGTQDHQDKDFSLDSHFRHLWF